jgi:two-component system response regulator GlrR
VTSAVLTPAAAFDKPMSDEPHEQPVHRVVIIDPREERRAITSLLVGRCPLLSVVGMAGDLVEAESQILAEQADVALLEIQLPVTEGLLVITALRDRFPVLRIVVCSFHRGLTTREEALRRGAAGYLTKPLDVGELLALAIGPEAVAGAPIGRL